MLTIVSNVIRAIGTYCKNLKMLEVSSIAFLPHLQMVKDVTYCAINQIQSSENQHCSYKPLLFNSVIQMPAFHISTYYR